MIENKYKILSNEIFEKIGGIANVISFVHCMTRLKITVQDYSKVDLEGLKKIDGVLGVVEDEMVEIILKPGVSIKLASEMNSELGVKEGKNFKEKLRSSPKENEKMKFHTETSRERSSDEKGDHRVLRHIYNIFSPLVPAFAGAGLIAGIASISQSLITVKILPANWDFGIEVLKIISSSLFVYLNIYVGINTAKEFNATPALGGIIGGVIYLSGSVATVSLPNIFGGQPLESGQDGVVGVLLSVWLMSYVERFIHKRIWPKFDVLLTPVLTILIMSLFTIFVIMAFASWVSNSLISALDWILTVGGPFAGFILGSCFLPTVMLGMNKLLRPLQLKIIEEIGYTPILPVLGMSGAGQVGAAIALWVKCRKNSQLIKTIKATLPAGLLGVSAPLVYGVTLPLGKPFLTACLGGGIGGAVISCFHEMGAISIGSSGWAMIPVIANNMWWAYCLGLLSAYASGFIATYLWAVPEKVYFDKSEESKVLKITPNKAFLKNKQIYKAADEKIFLAAVANGTIEDLGQVNDKIFSQKMLGDGYAILPDDGKVIAPADGEIVSIMPNSQHAIVFRTDDNLEILIHMGLETSELKGKPFHIKVHDGQKVQAGQEIAKMNLNMIINVGKDPVVIVTITNLDCVDDMKIISSGDVKVGQPVLEVKLRTKQTSVVSDIISEN